jgi:hypothetical protein
MMRVKPKRETLKTAVHHKIRRQPDMENIVEYLNGPTDGEMGQTNSNVPSLWSCARICTRAIHRTVGLEWL